MIWWSDRKIEYYNRAARFTDFHRKLADEIEKHVTKDESIIEFGAGLGYITEILNNDGYNVRAIEMDEKAIASANGRIGFDFLEKGDAYGEIPECDVILMIFFGRLAENGNLDHFLGKSKKIINISGRHKGYSLSRKEDHTMDLPELLEKRGIPYESIEFEAEFNQPLESIEDAHEWLKLTYGRDEIRELYEKENSEFPYEFRNRKRTVITVIDTNTKGERK